MRCVCACVDYERKCDLKRPVVLSVIHVLANIVHLPLPPHVVHSFVMNNFCFSIFSGQFLFVYCISQIFFSV